MSAPIIAFFNNKGGVGKTTLVYHLAWMFADLGVRVLAADLDPQANLTAAFFGDEVLETLWENWATIYTSVDPLVKRTGDVRAAEPWEVANNLSLIVGDLNLRGSRTCWRQDGQNVVAANKAVLWCRHLSGES